MTENQERKELHNKISLFQKSLLSSLENINYSMILNKEEYIEDASNLNIISSVENINSTFEDIMDLTCSLRKLAVNKQNVINKKKEAPTGGESKSKTVDNKIKYLEKVDIELSSCVYEMENSKYFRFNPN